jgi:hypothetical protein
MCASVLRLLFALSLLASVPGASAPTCLRGDCSCSGSVCMCASDNQGRCEFRCDSSCSVVCASNTTCTTDAAADASVTCNTFAECGADAGGFLSLDCHSSSNCVGRGTAGVSVSGTSFAVIDAWSGGAAAINAGSGVELTLVAEGNIGGSCDFASTCRLASGGSVHLRACQGVCSVQASGGVEADCSSLGAECYFDAGLALQANCGGTCQLATRADASVTCRQGADCVVAAGGNLSADCRSATCALAVGQQLNLGCQFGNCTFDAGGSVQVSCRSADFCRGRTLGSIDAGCGFGSNCDVTAATGSVRCENEPCRVNLARDGRVQTTNAEGAFLALGPRGFASLSGAASAVCSLNCIVEHEDPVTLTCLQPNLAPLTQCGDVGQACGSCSGGGGSGAGGSGAGGSGAGGSGAGGSGFGGALSAAELPRPQQLVVGCGCSSGPLWWLPVALLVVRRRIASARRRAAHL